ncbi:MAG: hypothetical protein J7L55_05725 [Desulfurococcales archaeon]|nr:hypothetical protein [Desulfurococcales archaeon]
MPEVKITLTEDEAKEVLSLHPSKKLEEAVKDLLMEALKGEVKCEVLEKEISNLNLVVANLKRIVMVAGDTINSYSQMLGDLRSRMADVVAMLQELNARVSELEAKFEAVGRQAEAPPPQRAEAREARPERRERRASAIEILKKQKVMFESDLASKIRNRDAFFERLRKDGALVLELADQRIAVDPEYWEEFLDRLSRLNTNSEKKLQEELGTVGHELLKALSKNALVYFDATKKKWVVLPS